MKLLTYLLIVLNIQSANALMQFPEDDRVYIPREDTGMAQYKTSLRGTKKIVLTFDDGPKVSTTMKLLDTLNKYQAPSTFFVLTDKIKNSNIHVIERMIREGHIIASHDSNHQNNNGESRATFKKDLKRSVLKLETLENELGFFQKEVYFRFPYGAYGRNRHYHHMNIIKEVSQDLFKENCINFAFWDIDTADWIPSMSPKDILQNVKANLEGGMGFTHKKDANGNWVKKSIRIAKGKKGGVILLHDVHERTIRSIPLILEWAQSNGYEVVPLSAVKEFSFKDKNCQLN